MVVNQVQNKKLYSIVLALSLVFSLSACGTQAVEPTSTAEPQEPTISSEPVVSNEPISAGDLSYSELDETQLKLFGEIAEQFSSDIQAGTLNANIKWAVEDYIATGELPSNAVELFDQYCGKMGLQCETDTSGAAKQFG